MKNNINAPIDPTKVVTGEKIKSTLLMTLPQFISIPGARTRMGVDGVRVDVPELPPMLLMKRVVPYMLFFKKTVYEINHDCLFSRLTKTEFETALDMCSIAIKNLATKNEKAV